MVMIGFAVVLQIAACNTFIQTIVEDDKRGRVMSFIAWRLWYGTLREFIFRLAS
jgi:hypothetical protein